MARSRQPNVAAPCSVAAPGGALPVSSTRLRTTRECREIAPSLGAGAPGVAVNQVERSPRRLRTSDAESTSGPALPFSVTVFTRPDANASICRPVTRPG